MVCQFLGNCSLSIECESRGDFSQPPCAVDRYYRINHIITEINAVTARYDLMVSNPHCEIPEGLKDDMEKLRNLTKSE